ncbi:MAG: CBS domain-containing protein [Candidatus Odinarchaeum yellowstonii]|jgi:CBS domain-containing protein|uniref:CBS domain-containing protein n=1 Tax=Odinarchaeota yellowstonii (strain LCB_4) TaxID=1841599 RepID=A0AAF0D1V9_ODILC|nr:MAG: CBS domain-containing protein [Candidatus Odinarchaeum yellowstonii]
MNYVIDAMREPKTCPPEMKINEAAQIMRKERIGSLIVVDENQKIQGLVTERDLVYRVLAEDRKPSNYTVKDVMTTNIVTVKPYNTIFEAIKIMREKHVRRLPVMKEDKLIGIITEREILSYILKAKEDIDKASIFKEIFL